MWQHLHDLRRRHLHNAFAFPGSYIHLEGCGFAEVAKKNSHRSQFNTE
jgi:hypothetical protein